MVSLVDVKMEGVKPQGEYQELGIGKYLIRIEDTEKKAVKDRFDEQGAPLPGNGKNFYLQIAQRVYGGERDGHVEFERLNLWNDNETAVNIAKSTLKSIQLALGVESADSSDFHNKWAVLEIKKNARGNLTKHYEKAPDSIIPKDVPAATPAQQPASVAAAAAPSAVPSWATKK